MTRFYGPQVYVTPFDTVGYVLPDAFDEFGADALVLGLPAVPLEFNTQLLSRQVVDNILTARSS